MFHGTQTIAVGITLILTLSACATSETQIDEAVVNERSSIAAEIRWTSYGIPHVKAQDWQSLGYGFAYATATDAVCVIAKDIAMVNGELSRFLGAEHLDSDVFHKAILTDEKITAFDAQQSRRANDFATGYAKGYNRYLRDNAASLPASCADAEWVRPCPQDVTRLAMGVGIRYGLGRFQAEIANAAPASTTADEDQNATASINTMVAAGRYRQQCGSGRPRPQRQPARHFAG